VRSVCVYCGSAPGRLPDYGEDARHLGEQLAEQGIRLVYGGAHVGSMGAVADAAMRAGGEVVGVIPRRMIAMEVAHEHLTELHVVESMHERKALMAELSDGFVALPGGMGTLEELTETLTWSQLGIHRKPVGLLNTAGYWDGLTGFFDHAVAEGFISRANRGLVLVETAPAALLARMAAWSPPAIPAWDAPEI
jgi:uncharacterized protein (TIGR00730 family)